MRDWLALPLNPNTNNSDEAITIDNEDGRTYDMMNKSAQKEQKSSELQGLSSWFSILNMFGVANQNNKKASGSSSRSIGHCSSTDNNVLEQDHSEESISAVQKSQEKESHHKEENKSYSHEEDFSNHEEDSISYHLSSDEEELSSQEQEPSAQKEETDVNEQDQVAYLNQEQVSHIEKSTVANQDEEDHLLVRSDSMSSIASSVETDNSTTATSEIKRSSYHKYNTMTHVKIYWNHGGKKVQVTGEFDNWSASVDMVQDSTENCHVTEIPMDLTKDTEYKFIVDGEWRYASDLPHRTDWRGNVNNVIYKQQHDGLLQSS